jgi:transcriptional regulator with XRE-family HTH domain
VLLPAPFLGASVRTMRIAKSSIGAKIKHRREELGLSQYAISDLTGISRAHISRIEGGKNSPLFGTVERLAKALRTSPASLLAA